MRKRKFNINDLVQRKKESEPKTTYRIDDVYQNKVWLVAVKGFDPGACWYCANELIKLN